MPPRDPGLPEGTDHIIDTNIDLGNGGGGSGGGGASAGGGATGGGATGGTSGGTAGAKASGGTSEGGGGSPAFKFDKNESGGNSGGGGIAGQVREQISTLKSQAGDRARTLADDGKKQATSLLETIADVVADAAGSVEERLGGQYAGVGNRASDSIRSLASTLDERSVDDLLEDARSFVQRSPAVAIGIAAVVGFAVARVVRSTIAEMRDDGGHDVGGGASGTGGGTGGLNATSGGFGGTGAGTAGNVGGTGTSTGAGSTGGTGNAPTV